ncbi:hypothetical protein JW960_03955 [candidate division KSB1 bacterium]|nr:hypothetical protein [candidate division KSB1 bacterium]
MQITLTNPALLFLLIVLLMSYVLLLFYLILKLRFLMQRISELFFRLDTTVKEIQLQQPAEKSRNIRNCQHCKNRIVFFHSEDKPYFYMKCKLNNEAVNPEDFCHHFVYDPQTYEI